VATVTPAEQLVGGRPLQLSLNEDGVALAQPRLVTDGDVHGAVTSPVSWTSTWAPAPRTRRPGRLRSDERVGQGVDGGQVTGQASAEVMPGGERVR
jgi:hypothetical protein